MPRPQTCRRMRMDPKPEAQKCAGCGKVISERYLLKAMDLFWHEDCLKCGCCDCRLGEVGSTLYTKANLILFCVGDRFYLCENKILCEYDYEERLVFSQMVYSPSTVAHLKRQTSHLPPAAPNNGSTAPPLLNGSPPMNGASRANLAPSSTGATNGAADGQRGDLNNNMGIVGAQSPLPFKNLPPLSMAGS
ncbi:hypothetical protein FOCC_FOCC008449 [Frankliniella occidentalis]|nr:hypothetical protein FOCC_FOCC008449 [Frankliniella occidentalis]